MKKKITSIILIFILILSGCSIKGVTEPFDDGNPKNEGVVNEKNTLPKNNDDNNDIIENSTQNESDDLGNKNNSEEKVKYQVGEQMPMLDQRGAKISDLEKYMTITITDKKIYNNILEAGINESNLNPLCEIYPEFDVIPLSLTPDKYKDAKILMLDIHIQVEDWYLEEKLTEGSITKWKLSYVKEDDSYSFLGFPCYFSNSIKNSYYSMDLSEKEFDVKAAYIIDEELLNVDELDLSKLIYNVYGTGSSFKYIELFPNK